MHIIPILTEHKYETCVQHARPRPSSHASMPVHGASRPVQRRARAIREPCRPRANIINATISPVRPIALRIVSLQLRTYVRARFVPAHRRCEGTDSVGKPARPGSTSGRRSQDDLFCATVSRRACSRGTTEGGDGFVSRAPPRAYTRVAHEDEMKPFPADRSRAVTVEFR